MSSEGYPVLIPGSQRATYSDDMGGSAEADRAISWMHALDKDQVDSPPGWREMVPKPVNTYNRFEVERKLDFVHRERVRTSTTPGYPFYSDVYDESPSVFAVGFDHYSSLLDHMYDPVQTVIENKLMDRIQQSSINIGQFIAERRQLSNMVASTATKIARTFVSLRQGNFTQAARLLTSSNAASRYNRNQNIAGAWLELQYGWKPLLGDIHETAKLIAEKVHTDPPRIVRATAKHSEIFPPLEIPFNNYPQDPDFVWIRSHGETQGRGWLEMRMTSDFGRSLGRTGITNPYSLAWELVPYSFVVDWFVPVGAFLQRLQYDQGLVFSRGAISYKSSCKWRLQVKQKQTTAMHVDGEFDSTWNQRDVVDSNVKYFSRRPFATAPQPTFARPRDPYTPTRALNALALMANTIYNTPGGFKPPRWR